MLRARRTTPRQLAVCFGLLATWSAASTADVVKNRGVTLSLTGYGELDFAYLGYGADDTREGGALDDHRIVFDATRFVAKLIGKGPFDLEFEAEVEFEHGGTGVTREIEYEEFGEIETEVEKGGEVQLEELYVEKLIAGRYQVKAGRFYVAFGTLSDYYLPTDYLGAARSEAETTVLPAQWDEMGISATAWLGATRVTAQIVNGLDSSAFSSRRWIADGHQGAYETISARSLAGVVRTDVSLTPTIILGASVYAGGTSNRPLVDLVAQCDVPDADNVAPCGVLSAPVYLGEAHAHVRHQRWRGQAMVMAGTLRNAAAISERNARLSNTAGVARTPVADNAAFVSAEVGYDIAPTFCDQASWSLWPYVRFERYDTMVHVREDLFDNPRFARTTWHAGLSGQLADAFTAKLEAHHRTFGAESLRSETGARLTLGFVY